MKTNLTGTCVAGWAACIAVVTACALPSVGLADDHARGRQLFAFCQQCHGPDGGGMEMALAPAIAGMDAWYVEQQLKMFQSGARGTNPDDIAGMRMHPMARWLKTEADNKAAASYIASLPRTHPDAVIEGGNANKGKEYYAMCAACHGVDGMGNQAMNAPPLRGSDWYLLSALGRYKAGFKGDNQDNPNAMMMRGMAMSLADEQAMKDVVAYIMTLGN